MKTLNSLSKQTIDNCLLYWRIGTKHKGLLNVHFFKVANLKIGRLAGVQIIYLS